MSGENWVPDSVINLLMACSIETGTAIRQALDHHAPRTRVHQIDSAQGLQQALDFPGWHLAFSELEWADFSAFDLVSLLSEKGMEVPVFVLEGSGAEEIAIRCLESGLCRLIRCTPPYLRSLPRLVDDLLRRARKEKTQRLLEKQLIESEELFFDTFDHTSDLIQRIAPDGSITYTNRAWRNALGYTEEEAQSLKLQDILHPDSKVCCQDRFRRLLDGETLNCIDFKFVAKSGETVYLAGDCGSVIKDGGVVSTRGIFRNVTDTVKAEEALKITEARYQVLYENAPDIYTTIGPTGEILSINHNGAGMLGYDVQELIGESATKLIHPEDQRAVFECVEQLFGNPQAPADIEYRKIRKDGSIFWVHQRATPEPGLNAQRLLVVCRDITDKRLLEDQLAYQATHDVLTGLLNRREFERRLQQLLSADADPTDKHVLCFLDLDQFKNINDSCGHIAGDELLRQIAALLKGLVRSRDTLARIGGDEFTVLMEHVSLDKAIQIAEKIRATIESFEFHWRSQRFSIGVSIGIVPIQIGRSITDTLNLADMACYTAKKAGRNRVYTRHADAVHADLFDAP
jgi:diguanylate cyclase (GGDEF)-like protein/PAS domain S-box-containing protein